MHTRSLTDNTFIDNALLADGLTRDSLAMLFGQDQKATLPISQEETHSLAERRTMTDSSNATLHSLLEIGRELTAQRDLDTLLHLIMDRACQLLNAERCTLYLVDQEKGEIWSRLFQGTEKLVIRLKIGMGIAGYVAQSGETRNVADAYDDPYFNPEFDRKSGYRTRSMLTMPLRNRQGIIIGVIQMVNRRDGVFTIIEEETLSALCSFAAVAIENAQLLDTLKQAFDSFVVSLTEAIDARDPSTAGHSRRVTDYSRILGQAMGLSDDELYLLEQTAIVHDVGKIGVDDAILRKPGKLDPEEMAKMRRHAAESTRILSKVSFPRNLKDVAYLAGLHHERMDGRGYPYGKVGTEIPLLARIMHVADVFDAVSYKRYYHTGRTPEEAAEIIYQGAGPDFDPQVVEAFRVAWPDIRAHCLSYQAAEDPPMAVSPTAV